MLKKPSQDQVPAPGAMGGAGPGSPNLGCPVQQDTLPIKKGWGSKMLQLVQTLENDPLLRKAIEWILVIFLGLSWWVLAMLATAFR
jgi:hypothetical protein